MNILLINSNRYREPAPVVPIGLCAVASALQEAGFCVSVLDLCFDRDPARSIRRALAKNTPDLIGISVRNIDTSSGYKPVFLIEQVLNEVVRPVRSVFKGPIVAGGASLGINCAQILKYLDLEYAIQGDGESSMCELARSVAAGKAITGIPGLVVYRDGKIIEDVPPSQMDNLDTLPFARPWQWIDLPRYLRRGSTVQVQTKRGCALGCVYCSYKRIEGSTDRLRSPERIADEIAELAEHVSSLHVEIVDSAFNVPLKHAKEVLAALARRKLRKLRLTIVGLNPAAVDEELADLLCECGTIDVGFSVEAGNDEMLEALGKGFNTQRLSKATRILHSRHIPIQFFLLLGAPGETETTLQQTFQTMEQIADPWDLVMIGIGIGVYQGSPLSAQLALKNPALAKNLFFDPITFEPDGISLDRIKDYCRQQTATHANYMMYDECASGPPFLFRFIVSRLLPRTPFWEGYIARRKRGRASTGAGKPREPGSAASR